MIAAFSAPDVRLGNCALAVDVAANSINKANDAAHNLLVIFVNILFLPL
jgi:hypothetical protein